MITAITAAAVVLVAPLAAAAISSCHRNPMRTGDGHDQP